MLNKQSCCECLVVWGESLASFSPESCWLKSKLKVCFPLSACWICWSCWAGRVDGEEFCVCVCCFLFVCFFPPFPSLRVIPLLGSCVLIDTPLFARQQAIEHLTHDAGMSQTKSSMTKVAQKLSQKSNISKCHTRRQMKAFPLSLKPLKLHCWIAVLMNGAFFSPPLSFFPCIWVALFSP